MPELGMPASVAFVQPTSIAETVDALKTYAGEARLLAGGTALSILLRERLIHPSALISLHAVPDLGVIELLDDHVRLGALVTHREIERSALVQATLPVLAQAFGVVGNVRIRHAATVGGVLAEADYASDPPAVFLALDASVEAAGPTGVRQIPISDFFVGFYETALAPDECITAVHIPIPAAETRAVYEKYITRSAEDRPCIGVAATVRLSPDASTCEELRVAVGAAAETPRRFPDVELSAHGTSLADDVIQAIADAYADRIDTLSDMRGSAWYRTEMIRVWVRRAIQRAWHSQ
jgi:aerobic carbon-monoxide dehydrogenase medium subunit